MWGRACRFFSTQQGRANLTCDMVAKLASNMFLVGLGVPSILQRRYFPAFAALPGAAFCHGVRATRWPFHNVCIEMCSIVVVCIVWTKGSQPTFGCVLASAFWLWLQPFKGPYSISARITQVCVFLRIPGKRWGLGQNRRFWRFQPGFFHSNQEAARGRSLPFPTKSLRPWRQGAQSRSSGRSFHSQKTKRQQWVFCGKGIQGPCTW